MKSAIHAFDRAIGRQVAELPTRIRPLMEFFTLLGQPPFTVGIAAAVVGYGVALNKSFYFMAGSIAIVTLILTSLLKLFLHRARPRNDYVRGMLFQTFSFPSGHASGALVSYGMAALIISVRWPEWVIVTWICALALTFFISLSRIYLGAHYASDVIGGWIVGAIGLIAILLIL